LMQGKVGEAEGSWAAARRPPCSFVWNSAAVRNRMIMLVVPTRLS